MNSLFKTFLLFLVLFVSQLFSQEENALNYRYWEMRNRLKEQFLVIGDCHGCSIPASRYNSHTNSLHIDDESIRHLGWYIALLASENYLLRQSNASVSENVQELYYALKAIDRLDKIAELIWCVDDIKHELEWNGTTYSNPHAGNQCIDPDHTPPDYNYTDLNSNLNGFLIREDFPPYFASHFQDKFPGLLVHHVNNDGWIIDDQFTIHPPSEMSQDEVYYLMMGLAFVIKYIPAETKYDGINLVGLTRQICHRLMSQFNNSWIIKNPVTNNQVNLGSIAIEYSHLVAGAAMFIEGPIANNYDSDLIVMATEYLSNDIYTTIEYTPPSNKNASTNQNMLYLLMALSNRPTVSILNLNTPNNVKRYLNRDHHHAFQCHHFYGDINRALYDNDEDLGYSNNELYNFLIQIDCQGPYFYATCPNYNFNSMNCDGEWQYIGNLPNWEMDNSFVYSDPQVDSFGSDHNGHYNGIDWMLAHNVYLINSNNTSGFTNGRDAYFYDLEWPFLDQVDQSSGEGQPGTPEEPNLNPQSSWSDFTQQATQFIPRNIYAFNSITSSEKFKVKEFNYQLFDETTQTWNNENGTFKGTGHYKAGTEITLNPGFEVEIGAEFTAEIGDEVCEYSYLRIGRPNTQTEIIDHHLDQVYTNQSQGNAKNQRKANVNVSPNPCYKELNISVNATNKSQASYYVCSSDGRVVIPIQSVNLDLGINKLSLDVHLLQSGIYHLVISIEGKNEVVKIVKM